MNNYITKFSDAQDEARRLSRVLKRDVEARAVDCLCEFSKDCYLCAASGTYYELRYAFCDHIVRDGDDIECDASGCAEREREAAIVERVAFPRVSAPLQPCRERTIEEIEREVA